MALILIVDDDPDIIASTKLCLEHSGHDVVSATTRRDGMQLAQSGTVDLLILDIMMTEFDDGIVIAQELRAKGFAKPILIMSSISKVTGLSYGKDSDVTPVDDFLEKPVDPHVLIAKVNTLLNRRKGDNAS